MDPREALKAAVLGGAQLGAPTSPLGDFPELRSLYNVDFAAPAVSGASQASSYNTATTVANQEAAAKAAAQRQQDLADPSKYIKKPKSDGGFAFYDPEGNPISATEYARATGATPDEVLKDSQNVVDKAFVQDYKQLQDYINNKLNAKNDPQARSAAQNVETQVRKLYGIKLHQQDPTEVVNAFVKAYPTVFGHSDLSGVSTGGQPFGGLPAGKQGTSTLLPSSNTIKAANKKKTSRVSTGVTSIPKGK